MKKTGGLRMKKFFIICMSICASIGLIGCNSSGSEIASALEGNITRLVYSVGELDTVKASDLEGITGGGAVTVMAIITPAAVDETSGMTDSVKVDFTINNDKNINTTERTQENLGTTETQDQTNTNLVQSTPNVRRNRPPVRMRGTNPQRGYNARNRARNNEVNPGGTDNTGGNTTTTTDVNNNSALNTGMLNNNDTGLNNQDSMRSNLAATANVNTEENINKRTAGS